ncbi:hypothetical protein NECAME_11980 [Necator americanus]|uniref:Protein-tyrosine sulfotransferase n=1 Tax=Necator americanus TaxID=51031 RepID=W2T344_NECAM|nr:hypothetical protein NECAME_11980 [Necator americanus]ETN75984.1 hypothetical protein NECAME_11980 [Necator americanus]
MKVSGEETSIVPAILGIREQWTTRFMRKTANLSGITQQTLDDATSAFLLELIGKHGPLAKRLCNKDPYTAYSLSSLIRMFPNSKHILMIRDARATVHSMIERKVPVAGFNRSDIPVFYERLVQRPADEARRILNFLDVPWSDDVLRHQEKIGSEVKLNP